jgi:hypothetical protein
MTQGGGSNRPVSGCGRFDAWSGDLPFAGPRASSADAVTSALEAVAFRERAAALDSRARDALARDLVDLNNGHATAQGVMMLARVWLAQATARSSRTTEFRPVCLSSIRLRRPFGRRSIEPFGPAQAAGPSPRISSCVRPSRMW